MPYITHIAAWLSTAAATIAGLYFTHSSRCLWAFAFPLVMCIECQEEKENSEECDLED